ncbi:MAG: S-layer protein [Candidatus Woesearchaeota archaeon]|nr:MAG: S-layer protein [Candidatus Woesearchaeota archaeon]
MTFAIKAKKAIKKVAAMSVGAAMVGSTLFGAVAADLADYPSPFVEDGLWNTVIVVGADAAASDIAGAIDISATLSQQATTTYTTTTTTTTVSGGVNLASGDDKVFYGDQLGDAGLTSLTDADFATILADGTFTDDAGTDYDFTQKIDIGTETFANFGFGTSGNDLDDPMLLINLGTVPSTPIYTFVLDFDEAVNLSATDSIGEEITMFGKTYTIGSETTTTALQLLGGALPVSLDWGETKTVTFEGEDYEITLVGVQDENPNEATIRINGDSETIAQGGTKKIGGVDVYADQVNYYGLDAYPGDCIISLGADEVWLETGQEVSVGSDQDEIDNTGVNIAGDPEDCTQIRVNVSAQDNDFDHLLVGESFTDPVFGTIKVTFADAVDGPTITIGTGIDTNAARRTIDISAADADTLQMELTDSNGNSETIEWIYDEDPQNSGEENIRLADSNNNSIAVVEGATLDESGGASGGAVYTILNSNAEYSGMIEIDNLDDDDCTETDLDIKDIITGDTIVDWSNQNTDATKDFSFRGKTYTVSCADGAGITIVDSTDTKTNVFPYIELYSGYDHRVALTDEIVALINATTDYGDDNDTSLAEGTYIFPTGEVDVTYNDSEANVTEGVWVETDELTLGGSTNVLIGTVNYTFDCDAAAATVLCNVSLAEPGAASAGQINPMLLIVEEQDSADVANALIINVNDTGGTNDDLTVLAPFFTDAEDNQGFDDSDLTGYIDTFGTYALLDTAGDQDIITITVPEGQMYASVFISPIEATTTTTASTAGVTVHSVSGVDVAKLDTEVSDKTAKPMILVGGPCANDLVAELAADGKFRYGCVDWPGSNFGIIELAENAFGGTNVAMVVAGTTAADTRRATKVIKDFSDYSLSGMSMKVTGTQTSPVVEPYVEETTE